MEEKLPFPITDIFDTYSENQFNELALKLFYFQAQENEVYFNFIKHLHIAPESVTEIEQIPFLPISFFKTHEVVVKGTKPEKIFLSSGTGNGERSKHLVADLKLYEKSFLNGFKNSYGNPNCLCILALLPSYQEQGNSSLLYMVEKLIKITQHPYSGFYLENSKLISVLQELEATKQPTLLIGVSYALLDLIEKHSFNLQSTIVMETGGMKGRRKEMVKEELHTKLCKGFGVNVIHSEYGMTELLSQAYSKGNNIFSTPSWMKVLIRNTNEPLELIQEGQTGGINVIDLANIYSCAFIATQDLGKKNGNTFEVLGRFDDSDVRGCNLLVD